MIAQLGCRFKPPLETSRAAGAAELNDSIAVRFKTVSHKTAKVLIWTVVLVGLMELLEYVFLP